MKRYELKRDIPAFKAGEVFYLSDAGNLFRETDNVPVYGWTIIDKNPNILTDWFEEIKEPTRWKPDLGQKFYFLTNGGHLQDDTFDDEFEVDQAKLDIGNCFKTEEEAKRVAEYLKALAVVRGDATTKFVKGKGNWFVYYEADSNRLIVNSLYYQINHGVFGLPYFATKDDAQRSIDQHKDEWLTIFGIEEGTCD